MATRYDNEDLQKAVVKYYTEWNGKPPDWQTELQIESECSNEDDVSMIVSFEALYFICHPLDTPDSLADADLLRFKTDLY